MMKKVVALTLVSLFAVACSKEHEPPKTPDSSNAAGAGKAQAAQQEAVGKAAQDNEGGGLNFSPEIQRLCPGIKSPKFGFDSAQLRGEWTDALSKLADCMKTGGLAGKGVLLTGHTDPRGDDSYNMALGERRAESVKRAIEAFNVGGDRIDTTSRGKVDAVGTDEESWARDRRVDIDVRPSK